MGYRRRLTCWWWCRLVVALTITGVVAPLLQAACLDSSPLRTSAADPFPAAPEGTVPEQPGEESDTTPAREQEPVSEDIESTEGPACLAVSGPRRVLERRAVLMDPIRAAVAPGSIRSRAFRRESPGAAATIGLPILLCRHLC